MPGENKYRELFDFLWRIIQLFVENSDPILWRNKATLCEDKSFIYTENYTIKYID